MLGGLQMQVEFDDMSGPCTAAIVPKDTQQVETERF